MTKEKIIAIGGGVGPMAGVKLHELIIQNTQTDGTDQDHIEVHHYSRSHDIGDRTAYLEGKKVPDPAVGMCHTMRIAEEAARITKKEVVAGIPCNTFHAPRIWKRFLQLLDEGNIKVQVLHMLNETVDVIHQIVPNAKNIGLMSTTGTRRVGVYRQLLEPQGFKIVEVPEELQAELHDSIYNREWGIKAVSPITDRARSNFERYASILCNQNINAIILGCTEIPLALSEPEFRGIPLIDPMLALARALIREASPIKLKPLI